tara:strand:- start:5401 stop:6102 length:702 start_codon:yes stop_codon:yes gene_type:complete
MRSLTNIATLHKNQLVANAPFIFLVEIQDSQDPPRRYRLTNFDKRLYWGSDSNGEAFIYYPVPMVLGNLEETSEGDLPTLEIAIGNSGPISPLVIDPSDGFVGNPIRVIAVSTLDLDSGEAIIDETAKVADMMLTHEGMRFTVAGTELFQARFPQLIYSRFSCKWAFGSQQCGYNTFNSSAGYSKCGVTTDGVEVARPFSLAACTLVGDDEEANSLTRKHPARFGGEPGIPRG